MKEHKFLEVQKKY